MSKDQTAVKSSNIFQLSRARPDCHYGSVTVDFTPPPIVCKVSNSIVPGYLADRNFFTPAFVIPRDREYYENTSAFEKEKFQARILKANRLCSDSTQEDQNSPGIMPVPPGNNYCQICKSGFTCYEDHLKETSHQRQARFSKANTYIAQLCKSYAKKAANSGTHRKNKQIQKAAVRADAKKHPGPRAPNPGCPADPANLLKFQNYSTNVGSLVPTPDC